MIDNTNNFNEIMDRLKKTLKINSDTELAEKMELSRSNYSERKQRNSVPYENLINLCKKENISIDYILKNENKSSFYNNYQEKLENTIKNLNEKESKYFYFLIESELAKKEL